MTTDTCLNCNREFRPHCPFCGSYRVYALVRKQDIKTRPNGEQVTLRVFRCTKCAAQFNDDQWQTECTAPLLKVSVLRRKQDAMRDKRVDEVLTPEAIESAANATKNVNIMSLTGEDRIEAIRKMLQSATGDK